jgi:biotin operon repressor
MDHATVVVSGTKIAEEISSNRSEVWRLIQQLRALGVDVAGHPATGYQLRAVPDLLLPEILAPFCAARALKRTFIISTKWVRRTRLP